MNSDNNQQLVERAEQLLAEQKLAAAAIVGAVTAIFAAAAYGLTTATWDFSSGFAATGIGIAVGISMQFLGRGIEPIFAVLASIYTVLGCLLGNIFRAAVLLAQGNAFSIFDILQRNSIATVAEWSVANLSSIGLLFWAVAVWFAVFLVKRPMSRQDRLSLGTYTMQRK